MEGTPYTTSAVWVDVPVVPPVALALSGANPVWPDVLVSLVLPDATPATLELFDVAGRRLARRQVVRAGDHQTVNASEGLTLRSGIYFVRLSQGGRSLTRRVALVPSRTGSR
jgi:hypothetical protein